MTSEHEYLKNEIYKMWGEGSGQAIAIRKIIADLPAPDLRTHEEKASELDVAKREYSQNINELKSFYKDILSKKDEEISIRERFILSIGTRINGLLFVVNKSGIFTLRKVVTENLKSSAEKFEVRKKEMH